MLRSSKIPVTAGVFKFQKYFLNAIILLNLLSLIGLFLCRFYFFNVFHNPQAFTTYKSPILLPITWLALSSDY
jgi:hypothetical protein